MAKVVAAMSAILWEMASCLPMGLPHCTRSEDHSRQVLRHCLAVPTEPLGIDRRPSLSVVRAIFRPRPSLPMRFPFGIFTSVKERTALARARKPMKWQRCSTLTPFQPVSTTKAEILRVLASVAMTTSSSAMVPLVHHSLEPFRT